MRLTVLVVLATGLPAAGADHSDRAANERTLAAVEAALDKSDPGWRLADILAARNAACPPDDRNLTKLCEEIDKALPKRFDRWQGKYDWLPGPPHLNRLPTAAALTAARQELAAAEAAVRLAHTVRRRATGGRKLDVTADPISTILKSTQPVRNAAALLSVDAASAAADHDWPRAVAAAADTLHLCHSVGDEPGLVSQYVRMAVAAIAAAAIERSVGWGEPPAAALAPLQPALLAEADAPRLVFAFRGERGWTHRTYGELDAGRLEPNVLGIRPDGPAEDYTTFRRRLPLDRSNALEFLTELVSVACRPCHEQVHRIAALKPPEDRTEGPLGGSALLPPFDKAAASEWRTVARLRSAAVGIACERFRQDHGRWPADLGELKELLPTIPLDPYDGKPLRLAKRDDGLVIYAVGPDRQDDGGNLSYGNQKTGEDVGFRLWDVAARGAPR